MVRPGLKITALVLSCASGVLVSLYSQHSGLVMPLNNYRCTSDFVVKTVNLTEGNVVLSRGSVFMNLISSNISIGHYIGQMDFRSPDAPSVKKNVSRAIEFKNTLRGRSLRAETLIVTRNSSDQVSDDDVRKYTYDGFVIGAQRYANTTLLKNGAFVSGEGPFPRAVCLPSYDYR